MTRQKNKPNEGFLFGVEMTREQTLDALEKEYGSKNEDRSQ